MAELSPPRKSVELEDPGARELESESDEHFSDASEGRTAPSAPADRSEATSPIPITRVERVDDEPAYGEIPGTDAYQKRTQDAVPDEVEIVPEGQRSRSASRVSARDRPLTPGGSPVPKTVVEKIDPETPSHGDVPGTHAHKVRAADAVPDVILKAPQPPERKTEGKQRAFPIRRFSVPMTGQGSPTASMNRFPSLNDHESDDADDSDGVAAASNLRHDNDGQSDGEGEGNGDFGDDFDDFEEGGEGDDFGDFDDGFQQGEEPAETAFEKPPDHPSVPLSSPGPPVLNFDELTSLEQMISATQPYIDDLFPTSQDIPSISTDKQEDIRSIFLSERSASLWTQLVAPPPLQPPNWVRSRIRRLFLVSLGVPVDLDEILPASKQKKLILPSIHIPGEKSPRPSADERANGAIARLKRNNDSSASVESSASKVERKRRGPPPPPELDISSTTMLCSTTDAALRNFTDDELRSHIKRLEELKIRANEVFEYWTKRMESALGDKEAFEGVIENLVMHAKKVRK